MPASDQGVQTDHYKLVPRTLIFLTWRDRLLLLKGAPHKRLWADKYNGIGGHIERGEDVFSAAQRELKEETGITASDLWICGIVSIDTEPDVGILIFILRGELPENGENPPVIDFTSNEGSLEWVRRDSLDEIPMVEDLPAILPHILSIKPGEIPFSAHYHYGRDGKLEIDYYDHESSSLRRLQ
jgi:8-oxo-dGTP diphosphatase